MHLTFEIIGIVVVTLLALLELALAFVLVAEALDV